nr:response regulator [Cytophagales bacterium]
MNAAHYKSMLEKISLGFGSFEVNTVLNVEPKTFKWLDINPALEKMLGLRREDIIGRFVHVTDQKASVNGSIWTDLAERLKDPSTRTNHPLYHDSLDSWYDLEIIQTDDASISCFFRDITAEKRRLDEFEQFFSVNLSLLCIADINGRILKINAEWEKKLGYSTKELIGTDFIELVHPDDRAMTVTVLKNLRTQKDILEFTNRYICKDGSYKNVEWRLFLAGEKIIASAQDITKRIYTEQELTTTKNFLEQTARMARVGAWDADLVTKRLVWSDVTKQIHEVGPEYIPTFENSIGFYKEGYSRDKIANLLKRAISLGESFDEELELVTANGETRWIRTIGQPEFDENRCIRLSGVFQDINEKKIASENLQEARLMLESILSEIDDVVWSVKLPTFEVLFVTPSAERVYGIPVDEWRRDNTWWEKAIHPADKHVIPLIHEKFQKEGSWEVNYRIVDRAGNIKWVHNRGKIITDKEGTPIRIDGVLAEITASKQTEMELTFLSELQHILVDMALKYINIPLSNVRESLQESLTKLGEFTKADRVYIFKYDWANNLCINTFEWCGPEVTPQIDELQDVPIDILEDWIDAHQQGIEYYIYDVLALPKESILRQILEPQEIKSLLTLPLMNGTECIGFVGFDFVKRFYKYSESEKVLLSFFAQLLVNIELRNNILQELIAEREKAESASKFKSEFLANMSHEIRTPLNGVIGFTDLLLNTPLNALQKQYAENANISGKSLLGIINDILDFSKIEAGKLELEVIETDLIELLEHSVDIIKYHASQRGLEVLLNIPPDLPTHAYFDPIRLKQILINLLTNAVKFTEKGEVELSVTVITHSDAGTQFRFAVKDTGIGISEEQQEKLFKAFSQADSSTTRKFGGTGLGLSISNLLTEKMGGKLELSSKLGVGSEFYFILNTVASSPAKIADNGLAVNHVLVIDDNEKNRLILEHNFDHWGVSFTGCDNGYQGLKLIQKFDYDLLIIDYHMPLMDGLETIKIIRQKMKISAEKLPIILLHSSTDDHALRKSCAELQVRFNLIKPVKARELLQYIKNIHLTNVTLQPNLGVAKTTTPSLSGMEKVLLIAEDVPMNMMLIKTYLAKLIPNSKILEAINGIQALDLFKSTPKIDLIFMDVQMPEMDGITTTLKIRELENDTPNKTPIIALTAGALKEEREKCLRSGMNEFLSKPIKKEALESVLATFLKTAEHSEDHLAGLLTELSTIAIFDKNNIIESINNDLGVYAYMLDYALNLEERIVGLVSDIKANNPTELQQNLAYAVEATKAMCFARLSLLLEKTSSVPPNQVELLLRFYQQILLEWTDVKRTIKEELSHLEKLS